MIEKIKNKAKEVVGDVVEFYEDHSSDIAMGAYIVLIAVTSVWSGKVLRLWSKNQKLDMEIKTITLEQMKR